MIAALLMGPEYGKMVTDFLDTVFRLDGGREGAGIRALVRTHVRDRAQYMRRL